MKYSLLILSLVFCVATSAQTSGEWTLFNEINGVEFYQKETDCYPENIPNQTGILIKIVNTNNYSITAEWDLRIWYDNIEQTTNIKDSENHILVAMDSRQTVEGDCANPNGDLYIFKKFITFAGGAEMTNFQFDSLTIKKAE